MDEPIRATAIRSRPTTLTHRITARGHQLTIDEPSEKGGEDMGPTPQELLAASLAGCTAITVEMYSKRKGWDLGEIEVECEYTPAERGSPTRFELTLRLSRDLTEEQVERLRVVAGKCPVHRTLDGNILFEERIELV
jgi:putative redox protein